MRVNIITNINKTNKPTHTLTHWTPKPKKTKTKRQQQALVVEIMDCHMQ